MPRKGISENVAGLKARPRPRLRSWRTIYFGVFGGDMLGLVGTLVLALLVATAVLGPWLVTHDPILTTPGTLLPPSGEHWLGTDHFGRDVFSRTITSLRVDFVVAVIGVSGAIFIGSVIGLVCGYLGGWLDDVVMRFVDIV